MSLLASLLSACSTTVAEVPASLKSLPECIGGSRIEVLQACRFRVDAEEVCNHLNITMLTGDIYQIEVPSGQQWKDWNRPVSTPLTGEAGNWLMNLFVSFRRLPFEPWMILGLARSSCSETLGDGESCAVTNVRVDPISTFRKIRDPLRVCFFANDVPLLNWNNSGAVWIAVSRMHSGD